MEALCPIIYLFLGLQNIKFIIENVFRKTNAGKLFFDFNFISSFIFIREKNNSTGWNLFTLKQIAEQLNISVTTVSKA